MRSGDGIDWEEDEELVVTPRTPDLHMEDDEVEFTDFEYSDRHPTDWVISGPLKDSSTPGRRFGSWEQAESWAENKYGERLIRRVPEAAIGGRWAFLIKGVR